MTTKYSSDEIYTILEGELVSLQIKPHEILSENALCARFNVSRTIVRSSLQRLSQAGFLEIIPYVGTKVTAIDLESVNQFIYLRIAAECAVLKDFMKTMTPLQIEEMRFKKDLFEQVAGSLKDMSLLDAEKTNELLAKDLEFHHCYFRFMGKDMLWDYLTQPHPNYSRFIRLDMLGGKNIPDVLEEHRILMDAVDRRDTDAVDQIVSRHLYGGTRRLGSKLFSEEFEKYIKKTGTASA